jgi:hypothetical protein
LGLVGELQLQADSGDTADIVPPSPDALVGVNGAAGWGLDFVPDADGAGTPGLLVGEAGAAYLWVGPIEGERSLADAPGGTTTVTCLPAGTFEADL